jgi:hypothetical protein
VDGTGVHGAERSLLQRHGNTQLVRRARERRRRRSTCRANALFARRCQSRRWANLTSSPPWTTSARRFSCRRRGDIPVGTSAWTGACASPWPSSCACGSRRRGRASAARSACSLLTRTFVCALNKQACFGAAVTDLLSSMTPGRPFPRPRGGCVKDRRSAHAPLHGAGPHVRQRARATWAWSGPRRHEPRVPPHSAMGARAELGRGVIARLDALRQHRGCVHVMCAHTTRSLES